MPGAIEAGRLNTTLDLVYDTAVAPGRWPELLENLAGLFNSHFSDRFSRTWDFGKYGGQAYGLDKSDYQDVFLDTWVKRNAWSKRKPAQIGGEVLSTRDMVPPDELKQEAMYGEFLDPRDLHEGLRLVIWAGQGWINDISLLRPWSAGPFGRPEKKMAAVLMPHIQRAFQIERKLKSSIAVPMAFDDSGQAVFVLDSAAHLRRANQAGEALLAQADTLLLTAGQLSAQLPADTSRLHAAIWQAAAGPGDAALSGQVDIVRSGDRTPLTVFLVPLREESDWIAIPEPMILAMVFERQADPNRLAARYGLTAAEAALAKDLLAGMSLSDVADQHERSINTVRTHLSRLMSKTNTSRQAELMRRLIMA